MSHCAVFHPWGFGEAREFVCVIAALRRQLRRDGRLDDFAIHPRIRRHDVTESWNLDVRVHGPRAERKVRCGLTTAVVEETLIAHRRVYKPHGQLQREMPAAERDRTQRSKDPFSVLLTIASRRVARNVSLARSIRERNKEAESLAYLAESLLRATDVVDSRQ